MSGMTMIEGLTAMFGAVTLAGAGFGLWQARRALIAAMERRLARDRGRHRDAITALEATLAGSRAAADAALRDKLEAELARQRAAARALGV